MKYFIILFFVSFNTWSIETKWKAVKGAKEIEVYSGEVKGMDVVAFRGVSIIDAPIKNVASVLYDMSRKKEWMHNLKESRIVRYTGDLERIEYNQTDTPWPLDPRDFVYKAKVSISNDKNSVRLDINSVDEPTIPARSNENIIRGELKESVYRLESLEDGKKTKIDVEILADPKGDVPKWLVNIFQRMWPINTINGIKREVSREDFKVDEKVEKFFSNPSI